MIHLLCKFTELKKKPIEHYLYYKIGICFNSQRTHEISLMVDLSYWVFRMRFDWERLHLHGFSEILLHLENAGLPVKYFSHSFLFPLRLIHVIPQSHFSWMIRIFYGPQSRCFYLSCIFYLRIWILCKTCISRVPKPCEDFNLALSDHWHNLKSKNKGFSLTEFLWIRLVLRSHRREFNY